MLARMYASDPTADGLFITGVRTTGIYCLPSCSARKPNACNVSFFATERAALDVGLRACKRCRPDRFYAGLDPDRDRLRAARALLEHDPSSIPDVAALAGRVGVGRSKLHVLVRRYARTTPLELMHDARIGAAKRLLRSGEATATNAAFAVGYESVSAFYVRFKQATGQTPGQFARAVGRETPGSDSAARVGGEPAGGGG